jgi:hypothetical protein
MAATMAASEMAVICHFARNLKFPFDIDMKKLFGNDLQQFFKKKFEKGGYGFSICCIFINKCFLETSYFSSCHISVVFQSISTSKCFLNTSSNCFSRFIGKMIFKLAFKMAETYLHVEIEWELNVF